MSEPAFAAAPRPYRDGILAGVGTSLLAGLGVAGVDVVHMLGDGGGAAAIPALLALWALPALLMGVAIGLVAASVKATWGDGAIGAALARLRADRGLDLEVTGAVLAAGLAGLLVVPLTAIGASVLVANVQRKGVGALLLGVAVLGALPVLAAAAIALFRATRRVAVVVPRLGALPRVAAL